ncbi:MAG: Mur ligase family protein [Sumerlaeia bacterium]
MTLLDRLIDLERQPAARAYTAEAYDLEGFRRWLETMGNPQRATRALHIAGTKGKGSTAAMVEAILRGAGMRTGLYTSPHLEHYGERFRVGGAALTLAEFEEALEGLIAPHARERVEGGQAKDGAFRTVFECLTALAFRLFADEGVEASVYEVGLGGRLDCTNVVEPAVCAITPIGRDHTRLLGDDIALIAREKAGIIKPRVPVVVFEARTPIQHDAHRVIVSRAAEVGAPMLAPAPVEILNRRPVGQRVRVTLPTGEEATAMLPLLGDHQARNLGVAVAMADRFLRDAGRGPLRAEVLARGLRALDWRGRLEVFPGPPGLVIDGAHCPTSARALGEALEHVAGVAPGPYVLLWGMQADKDARQFLHALLTSAPHDAIFQAVCYEVPGGRGAKAAALAEAARAEGLLAIEAPGLAEAVQQAAEAPGAKSVLATGTLYTLRAIEDAMGQRGL